MVRNKTVAQHGRGGVFIGRENDVSRVLERLEHSGVLLVGPRRIGKTSLLKHLCDAPPEGILAVRVNLEGLEDLAGAVDRIAEALTAAKLVTKKILQNLGDVSLTVAGVGTVTRKGDTAQPEPPWRLLEAMVEQAVSTLESHQRLALFLDEVPWWLDALRRPRRDDGDDDAMRVRTADARARTALAQLRYLRQRDDMTERLRMIFTGSVGISSLAEALQSADAIRDLSHYELRPMAATDGAALFDYELTLRDVGCHPDAADAACRLAGGSPHWIKQLAVLAAEVPRGSVVQVADVERAVNALLAARMRHVFDDEGNAHLHRRHGHDARVMKRVLSTASASDHGVPRSRLVAAAIEGGVRKRDEAERIVWALIDEFYLEPADDERLRFLNPLLRRWWERYGATS